MFVPQIWLRDFVSIPEDIKEFDRIMTRSGTMVEGYEYRGEGLENIVSARVETIKRHPDSDHMWVCSLTDGKNTYQVVTSEDYMGPALANAGYITLGQNDTGDYIKQTQGVTPASGCVWQLWKGDSYKDLPVGTTPVEHGATYTIVYKRLK